MIVRINEKKCKNNHVCYAMDACPKSAITQESPNDTPTIDTELCVICMMCKRFCPAGAIEQA